MYLKNICMKTFQIICTVIFINSAYRGGTQLHFIVSKYIGTIKLTFCKQHADFFS